MRACGGGSAPPTGVSALQHLFAPRLITEDAVVEKDRFVSSFRGNTDGSFHPVKVIGQVIEVAGKTVLLMGGKTDGIPVDRWNHLFDLLHAPQICGAVVTPEKNIVTGIVTTMEFPLRISGSTIEKV